MPKFLKYKKNKHDVINGSTEYDQIFIWAAIKLRTRLIGAVEAVAEVVVETVSRE